MTKTAEAAEFQAAMDRTDAAEVLLSTAIGKRELPINSNHRPQAPFTQPRPAVMTGDRAAQASLTRAELERSSTSRILKSSMVERENLVVIRDAQERIVAALEDHLAFERARLDDQNTAIRTLDILTEQLEKGGV